MLLGETAEQMQNLPLTLLEYQAVIATAPTATNPKGRIGEVYPNFATVKQKEKRYTQFKFYGTIIYAPSSSAEILKAGYGAKCLSHAIDKYRDNAEYDVK